MDTEQLIEDYINSIEFDNFIETTEFNFMNEYTSKQLGRYIIIYTIEKTPITADEVIKLNKSNIMEIANNSKNFNQEKVDKITELITNKYEEMLYRKIREFDKELQNSLFNYIVENTDVDEIDGDVEISSAPYIDEDELHPMNLLEKVSEVL